MSQLLPTDNKCTVLLMINLSHGSWQNSNSNHFKVLCFFSWIFKISSREHITPLQIFAFWNSLRGSGTGSRQSETSMMIDYNICIWCYHLVHPSTGFWSSAYSIKSSILRLSKQYTNLWNGSYTKPPQPPISTFSSSQPLLLKLLFTYTWTHVLE